MIGVVLSNAIFCLAEQTEDEALAFTDLERTARGDRDSFSRFEPKFFSLGDLKHEMIKCGSYHILFHSFKGFEK